MNKTLLLSLLALSASTPALAKKFDGKMGKPPSAEKPDPLAYAAKFSLFTKWDDVAGEMKGGFPPSTIKEFLKVTKGEPFPKLIQQKTTVKIVREKDGKTAFLTFEKGGRTKWNGIPIKMDPLASVAERTEYLVGLKKQASLMDSIFPSAWAANPYGGLEFAGESGASNWKAQDCASADPNSEEGMDCTLMAVEATMDQNPDEKARLRPIVLKCPKRQNGVLEFWRKGGVDVSNRTSATFVNGKIIFLREEAVPDNGDEVNVFYNQDPTGESRPSWGMIPADVKTLKLLKEKVCNGSPAIRARFEERLESNKEVVDSMIPPVRRGQGPDGNEGENTSME